MTPTLSNHLALIGSQTKLPVRQWPMVACRGWRLTAIAQVAVVVLRLVVHPHMVSDVRGRQQLPADVTWHLLLVADEVCAEAVPRGEGRRARLYGMGRSHRESRGVKEAAGWLGGGVGREWTETFTVHLKGLSVEWT